MIHSSIYKMRDANDKGSSSSGGVSKGGARDAPPGYKLFRLGKFGKIVC